MIESLSHINVGILALIFAVAVLYSSVGHGGGSGYLAVLSLFGMPADQMATSALILNILVAGIGVLAFVRAGYFSSRLVWPFLLGSVPTAFLGGWIIVSSHIYAVLLAICLTIAMGRLLMNMHSAGTLQSKPPGIFAALFFGALIGLLSGVVGIGGGFS